MLAAGFIHYVLNSTPPLVFQLAATALGDSGGWIALAIGTTATSLVTTAFLAGFAVALYLDLRVRNEGLSWGCSPQADKHFAGAA